MLEAYEQQEKDFMEREQVLLNKLQSAPSKEKLVGCHLTTSGRRFVSCYKSYQLILLEFTDFQV